MVGTQLLGALFAHLADACEFVHDERNEHVERIPQNQKVKRQKVESGQQRVIGQRDLIVQNVIPIVRHSHLVQRQSRRRSRTEILIRQLRFALVVEDFDADHQIDVRNANNQAKENKDGPKARVQRKDDATQARKHRVQPKHAQRTEKAADRDGMPGAYQIRHLGNGRTHSAETVKPEFAHIESSAEKRQLDHAFEQEDKAENLLDNVQRVKLVALVRD